MLAYDYPLLSIFLSVLWFAIIVGWIMALFSVLIDIFRSHDMGGVAKAVWLLFVILLPLLGVLIYVVARGGKMAEHSLAQAQKQQALMEEYARATSGAGAGGGSSADELAKLAGLRDQGVIDESEFQAAKAKILAG